MNSDDFNKYLESRYDEQINWYSDKASGYKKTYQFFQWSVIIVASSLPVLISVLPDKYKWITIAISIVLAIFTAALKTFKWQEIWLNYRTISETLKKEKHFYDAEVDEYGTIDDKEKLFVERVETLISRENSLWIMTHEKSEKGGGGKKEIGLTGNNL
ncbi:MAG: DUF4231 domain-containing protein [Phycisphaerae bacterium]|nr:DUF4231 domain-containing protein [Phycisphaerae bacterium]